MLLVASLAPFCLLLATGTAANPLIVARDSATGFSLPIVKRINPNGTLNVVQRDQARAASFANRSGVLALDSTVPELPLIDSANTYVASIGVGSPTTYYELIVDTGSANTWVGANNSYVGTPTSEKTSDSVKVIYGSASFKGTEYLDTVTVSPSVAIQHQSIGVASKSSGVPFDGIMGIGPKDLSVNTLSSDSSTAIPTVTDNLFSQGLIGQNLVAISFEPTTSSSVTNGELSFGAVDSTKFTGSLTSFPITKNSPSSSFWGVDASFQYGDTTLISPGSGIFDTGSTTINLNTDAYYHYMDKTHATYDDDTGFLRISSKHYKKLQSLYFIVGGTTYELTPNAQTWPRALNSVIGGRDDRIYLVVGDIGDGIPGMDFICGMAFMERFYLVLDTGGQQISLATTQFTDAETN